MAKRTATTDLNHDNWDREEGPEEAGTFSRASEDALKKRVIKVAKRRNPISPNEDGKSSAFGGFSGFGKTSASANNAFGFLTNLANKSEAPKTNGTPEKEPENDKKLEEYYSKLKGLNESVAEWIKKHVSANPLINLQPVFKDYDKYINDLEKIKTEATVDKTEKSSEISSTVSNASTVTVPQFSFGTVSNSFPKSSFGTTTTGSNAFSFGTSSTTSSFGSSTTTGTNATSQKPLFSFGSTSSTSTGKFSFTSTVVKPADEPAKTEDAEDDEPPKVEFTPVVEEGHVYSTRCKVFVKKDGAFADHGVGTLYLKPIADSEKVQLIVRAETNLGRLICNFILSESIPMQRMGKKDVMLLCVPNPETQPPPVPILLRVKSPEDADELLKTLQKHKK